MHLLRISIVALLMTSCLPLVQVMDAMSSSFKLHETFTLTEGETRQFVIPSGSYRIDMTATAEGASLRWAEPGCAKSGESRSHSVLCQFDSPRTIIIENPTWLSMGGTAVVTLLVTAIGHEAGAVLVDQTTLLYDGSGYSIPLTPGTYRLDVTAHGGDAAVRWDVVECLNTYSPVTTFTALCTVYRDGASVHIENPTMFGLGSSSNMQVKLVMVAPLKECAASAMGC